MCLKFRRSEVQIPLLGTTGSRVFCLACLGSVIFPQLDCNCPDCTKERVALGWEECKPSFPEDHPWGAAPLMQRKAC